MARKRKFEPSKELQFKLLELAGMDTPELAPTAEDFLGDAVKLKRLADRGDGPSRYLFYVRSCLRYFEYTVSKNGDVAFELDTLGSTAKLLEYAAHKTRSLVRQGIEADDLTQIKDYAHLAVLAFRLAAVARFQRYVAKSAKIKRFHDQCGLFESKAVKHERVRQANAVSGIMAPGPSFTPEERQQNEEYSRFIVKESADVANALDHWRMASTIIDDVRQKFGAEQVPRLALLPPMYLLHSEEGLGDLPKRVRKSLEEMYD